MRGTRNFDPMDRLGIDAARCPDRLHALSAVGRDEQGRLCRLAASDADRAGRDRVAGR
jgi:beta-ureidopropionase / N-carbamoyl-L-amino-acid hydrolase